MWAFWAALACAGVLPGLVALVIGVPTLRLSGVYLAMATLGFGEVVRVVSGKTLDAYTREAVFMPLKMVDSGFLPPAEKLGRIAPTEIMDGKLIHGVVHDPTSRRMGGVAGHAGLFTTAADLARFCQMLLNGEIGRAHV